MTTPNENQAGEKHPPECECDKCFAEFKTFCETFNPTLKEQLEMSEALKKDLFKRVLKYESEAQSLRAELATLRQEKEKWQTDLKDLRDRNASRRDHS